MFRMGEYEVANVSQVDGECIRESSRPRLLCKRLAVSTPLDGDMENITSTNMEIRINVHLIDWGVTPAFDELGKIECNHSFSSFGSK